MQQQQQQQQQQQYNNTNNNHNNNNNNNNNNEKGRKQKQAAEINKLEEQRWNGDMWNLGDQVGAKSLRVGTLSYLKYYVY